MPLRIRYTGGETKRKQSTTHPSVGDPTAKIVFEKGTVYELDGRDAFRLLRQRPIDFERVQPDDDDYQRKASKPKIEMASVPSKVPTSAQPLPSGRSIGSVAPGDGVMMRATRSGTYKYDEEVIRVQKGEVYYVPANIKDDLLAVKPKLLALVEESE